MGFDILEELIKKKKADDETLRQFLSQFMEVHAEQRTDETPMQIRENLSRILNINVGDQKNTANIQGCVNRCPDMYSSHTPGGGDFHNRGYLNECIARVAGQGGFWHVVQEVMKKPTVNPSSFNKYKFKDNNYNNNEEALLDYDDGVSIAMLKVFQASEYFPSDEELTECYEKNIAHNDILLKKFDEWVTAMVKKDKQFAYQSMIVNNLMPITRWYKESIRYGNGIAVEGVWMLCPQVYAALGKINYRDESFTMLANTLAKWPLAYRKMYQQNRCVNVNGKKGRQLAGDEWVEGHLVRPVKQYANAQTSFSMLEMMSCSTNVLESARQMYKSREAFDIHNTRKHCTPGSLYDQLKVAKFAMNEEWFVDKKREVAKRYSWKDNNCKEDARVQKKYLDVLETGEKKAKEEFSSFLYRKFPNDVM